MNYLPFRTVSPHLRLLLVDSFPSAFNTPEFLVLLERILFHPHLLDPSKEFYLHSKSFSRLLGWHDTSRPVIDLLQSFERETGIELNIGPHSWKEGKSRTLSPTFPSSIIEAVSKDYEHISEPDRVLLSTGEKRNERKRNAASKRNHEYYYQSPSSIITEYFHDVVKPIKYSKYYHAVDEVIRNALADGSLSIHKRRQYLGNLAVLRDDLFPKYMEPSCYTRLFAEGYSLQSLKKKYRRQILYETVEVDLTSAHLYIAAYKWDLRLLKAFLESGTNAWQGLCNMVDLPYSEGIKGTLKHAIYCVVNGAGTEKVIENLRGIPEKVKTDFLQLPIVTEIREASKQRQENIQASNSTIELADGTSVQQWKKPSSLVAIELQSYERYAIEGCYIAARKYKNTCTILSHEHDGITFSLHDVTKRETVLSAMRREVQKRGKEQGIPLFLEVKS